MRLSCIVTGIHVCLAVVSFAADVSAIDGYVQQEIDVNDIPGAAVAVWHKGGIVYQKGFGVRSTVTNEPMAADTLVDLASVSKSFTAVAVIQLSGKRRVDLDSPVAKYLPELGERFSRIKIRHLIRHSSGLTRREDNLLPCCGPSVGADLESAVTGLSAAKPSRTPGSGFSYANSNYVLLAAVVQRVSGQTFAEYMREFVFRPLAMFRTTLDSLDAGRMGLADPHVRRWCEVLPNASAFSGWHGSSLVKSTAQDMAAYLGWVIDAAGKYTSEPYDAGWFIRRGREWPGNPVVLEHGGDTSGGNTAAIVVPAWRMGAVVLLNLGAHRAAEIARGVLVRWAGVPAPRPARSTRCRPDAYRAGVSNVR